MRPRVVRIVVALAGLALVGFAHPHPAPPGEIDLDERFVLRPEAARMGSLGFEALGSDYHWLQAVQLVGNSQVDPSRYAHWIERLIDVVTTLDPWVDHPYRFASLFLNGSPEQVRAGNRFLERGIAYHPEDWRNRFYLSFNHFFYLGDVASAARELAPAVGAPGAPRYLGRLLARLRSESGGLDAAAVYLEGLVRTAPDGYHRAEYEKALDEIETERRARFLGHAREAYRERHGRDIERVEDLVAGGVLSGLPPEPNDWEWSLHEETGEIVSTFYGRRYVLHMRPEDAERRRAWGTDAAERAEDGGGAEQP